MDKAVAWLASVVCLDFCVLIIREFELDVRNPLNWIYQ